MSNKEAMRGGSKEGVTKTYTHFGRGSLIGLESVRSKTKHDARKRSTDEMGSYVIELGIEDATID